MNNEKILKIVGVAVTVAGAALSVASSFIDDKKLDGKVADKVAEALAKTSDKES